MNSAIHKVREMIHSTPKLDTLEGLLGLVSFKEDGGVISQICQSKNMIFGSIKFIHIDKNLKFKCNSGRIDLSRGAYETLV